MSAIDPAQRDRYADAGLVHMLSVSGLHVGIIALALELLGAALRLPARAARVASLLLLLAYVAAIGAPPPAVRAAVMLGVLLVSRLRQRPTSPWAILRARRRGAARRAEHGARPRLAVERRRDRGAHGGRRPGAASRAAIVARTAPNDRHRRDHQPRRHGDDGAARRVGVRTCRARRAGDQSRGGPDHGSAAAHAVRRALHSDPAASSRSVADAAHALLAAFDAIARAGAAVPGGALAITPSTSSAILAGVAAVATLVACASRTSQRARCWSGCRRSPRSCSPRSCAGDRARHRAAHDRRRAGRRDRAPHSQESLGARGRGAQLARRRCGPVDRGAVPARTAAARSRCSCCRIRTRITSAVPRRSSRRCVRHASSIRVTSAPATLSRRARRGGARSHSRGSACVRATRSRRRVDAHRARPGLDAGPPDSTDAESGEHGARGACRRDPLPLHGRRRGTGRGVAAVARCRRARGRRAQGGPSRQLDEHEPSVSSARCARGSRSCRVGARNAYGHPSPEVLQALRDSGAQVLRTDRLGTIVVSTDGRHLEVEARDERWSIPDRPSRDRERAGPIVRAASALWRGLVGARCASRVAARALSGARPRALAPRRAARAHRRVVPRSRDRVGDHVRPNGLARARRRRSTPELLLHELRHVHQFQADRAFPLRYVWRSLRHGYLRNRLRGRTRGAVRREPRRRASLPTRGGSPWSSTPRRRSSRSSASSSSRSACTPRPRASCPASCTISRSRRR